jgi:two-component system response regulator HydG
VEALRPQLLVVDDERPILSLIRAIAVGEGFDVSTSVDGADALAQLRRRPVDLVLVDLRMPGVSGMDVLRAVREINPSCRVVLMSGFATIDSAVEAVKLGAADYLTKPFDLARVRKLLATVRDEAERRRTVLALDSELAQRLEFCGMIGRSPAMQEVFSLIRRLAPHARTALISGETGTGKELAARALHTLGPRSGGRFVAVNCSAVVETLFESELFGHVRGAFTGATDHKAGLFELADGGTLFLDEVGELPAPLQAKLLRVIETGEVKRVGALEARRVDVRLIAATNRDLRVEVAAGRFRSDLFYRLNVAEVTLPPLRERREDIPYLAAAFIREFSERFDKPITGMTPGAERLLAQASWEGNVRQLRNVLERACMLAETDIIGEADLAVLAAGDRGAKADARATSGADREAPGKPSPAIGVDQLAAAMERVKGNKTAAARLLGISRRALYRLLERHGLHRSHKGSGVASATGC